MNDKLVIALGLVAVMYLFRHSITEKFGNTPASAGISSALKDLPLVVPNKQISAGAIKNDHLPEPSLNLPQYDERLDF